MKPVLVVAGTRPEIIKMAPIIKALNRTKTPSIFVHCGQNYDYDITKKFIEELEIPTPDFSFRIESTSTGLQTAEMFSKLNHLFETVEPSIVLVEGDTNSVLAAAIAANKWMLPIGHVEAGLRSFDLRMPEEHNRRLTDHISGYLFAPTERAKANLKKEKAWGKIFLTGNTVIDAVMQHLPCAEKKSTITERILFKEFALVTTNRPENVDHATILNSLMEAFLSSPIPIVYLMNPRTRKRLLENNLLAKIETSNNLQILPPQSFSDFLVLMKNCRLIITDSGCIQEEATTPSIRKPTIVTRLSTERPEAVEAGFAKVVGTDSENILAAIDEIERNGPEMPYVSPFGDGTAAQKTVSILKENLL